MYYTEEIVHPHGESPAEKVLRLALELPATRPQLEKEAQRLESLLDGLQQPASQTGTHLMIRLIEILEGQLDGIYGLLDGDDQQFHDSLELLVECDARLSQLENEIEEYREDLPLVA